MHATTILGILDLTQHNLKSWCFKNNTYDLEILRSILDDEEISVDLEYLTIFHLMALSKTLACEYDEIFYVRMKVGALFV